MARRPILTKDKSQWWKYFTKKQILKKWAFQRWLLRPRYCHGVSPPEYCRLFAQKKAYQGGVTGPPGPPPPPPPLATLLYYSSKPKLNHIIFSGNAIKKKRRKFFFGYSLGWASKVVKRSRCFLFFLFVSLFYWLRFHLPSIRTWARVYKILS